MRGLEKVFAIGVPVLLYGTPMLRSDGVFTMTTPDFATSAEAKRSFSGIVPVYPLTEGLTQKQLRAFVREAVERYSGALTDPLPPSVAARRSGPDFAFAVREMHLPASSESWRAARERIAFGELFTLQLELARQRRAFMDGSPVKPKRGGIYAAMLAALPFQLTASQKKAIDEIITDASSGGAMLRLLQGDVGCGKSVVASAFAASLCDAGAQCAVMAPTEVLAEQLYRDTVKYLAPYGVKTGKLTSSMNAAERADLLRGLEDGSTSVVTGTHSLLSDKVKFKNLGAVVIDEQQRFGVRQRARLLERGERPHCLMMSATPIPRTLAASIYGDLGVSSITERPEGRKPVETRILSLKRLPELMQFLLREIGAGGRVYWICPRVEDEAESTLTAAKRRMDWLVKKLPPVGVALVHGQMEAALKDEALSGFRSGKAQILVGTTVLEVGVDVPEASVIVIESPERYGLAQLHQMRGRVGRGSRRGLCVLLTAGEAPQRLSLFASTTDGFKIAEADLAARGAGELAGLLQHGDSGLRAADLVRDAELAAEARREADFYLDAEGR